MAGGLGEVVEAAQPIRSFARQGAEAPWDLLVAVEEALDTFEARKPK